MESKLKQSVITEIEGQIIKPDTNDLDTLDTGKEHMFAAAETS